MERVNESHIKLYIDTTKQTIEQEFTTVADLIAYLEGLDDGLGDWLLRGLKGKHRTND